MSSSNDTRISRRTPAKTQNEIQRDIDKVKNKKVLTIVILVLVAILAIALIYINTGIFYRSTTALSVGDRNFSIADFNYYYKSAYNNTYNSLYSTYGDYISYLIDPSKPLDQQNYNSDMTWEEYFTQLAVSEMCTVTMLNELADKDESFSLTDEQQEDIESLAKVPQAYADMYKISTGSYLRNVYGKGVNKSVYRDNITDMYIADAYAQYIKDNYEYTDADIEAYYAENSKQFDTVTYAAYFVKAATGDDVDAETALADAKAAAQKLVDGVDSIDAFTALVDEYEKENELSTGATTGKYASEETLNEDYAEWLCDSARVFGDTAVIVDEDETGYYAVFFDSVDNKDYSSAEIRQILVAAETDDNDSYTDESLAAAHTKAEELLAEWQSGDMTAESFEQLYTDHSSEEHITSTLIDNIYHGATGVEDVENWALDTARQAGDVTLVDTSYGTHILYYVSVKDNAQKTLVINAKSDDDYSAWLEENIADYTSLVHKFGYYFTRNV